MREIKFRIFYGIDGQEDTYHHEDFSFGEIENGIHAPEHQVTTDQLVAGWDIVGKAEYTGLKDKNGKEIYEGDLLESMASHKGSFLKIEFITACFCVKAKFGTTMPLYKINKKRKIIGNIYENPELLEKET